MFETEQQKAGPTQDHSPDPRFLFCNIGAARTQIVAADVSKEIPAQPRQRVTLF